MTSAFLESTPTLPPHWTGVGRARRPAPATGVHRTRAGGPAVGEASVEAAIDQAVRDMRANKLDDAEKALLSLVQRRPEVARAHANLGLVFRRLGRLDDAAHELEEATRLAPGHAGYHNQLGLTNRMLGHLDQARRCYERALEIDPDHAGALINLGILHDRCFDEPARAVALYARGAALLPADAATISRWLDEVTRRSATKARSPGAGAAGAAGAAAGVDADAARTSLRD